MTIMNNSNPRRLLVVAVQTIAGPSAGSELYKKSQEQDTEFHLLMPVMKPEYGMTWTEAQADKDAEDRLALMLEFMRRAGMKVTGEIARGDPVAVVRATIDAKGPFDGIVVVWRQKKHRLLYASEGRALADELGIPLDEVRADPPAKKSSIENADKLRDAFREWEKSLR